MLAHLRYYSLGDKALGITSRISFFEKTVRFGQTYLLHAQNLVITLPDTSKTLSIHAEIPPHCLKKIMFRMGGKSASSSSMVSLLAKKKFFSSIIIYWKKIML